VLVESDVPFGVLTHLDYPKRYWPHDDLPFAESDYQDEYRTVLRALARSGRVLEVNTNRDMGPPRGPNPDRSVLGWWYDEGGTAVSFGSDAHRPEDVAAGFATAAEMAEAVGFRPGHDLSDYWRR
jgi:histidinol-phosphatase (PHP family)